MERNCGGVVGAVWPEVGAGANAWGAGWRRLPDGYREVVIRSHRCGDKVREIAERRGRTEGTSKSQLARGRARLRTMLD